MIPEKLTVSWLRKQYLDGTLTPEQVIGEIRDRIHRDKHMNIWISVLADGDFIPYLNSLLLMKPEQHPLWGIPFAIKDNIDLQGVKTTAGCEQYAYIPQQSAWVVRKLVEAGAIPMGKVNMDQFATGLVGTRSPYGEVHNALHPEYISGGSSSGSSVAVARGHVAFALGTDTAGSGRVPAMLNRTVGWKAAPGEWSLGGVVPACASLDCVSVFTHTVQDAACVDRICRQQDDQCEWMRPAAAPVVRPPERICLPDKQPHFFGDDADDYRKAWVETVKRLANLGIPVEYVDCSIFTETASLLYDGSWVAERYAVLKEFIQSNEEYLHPVTREIICKDVDRWKANDVFTAMHKLQKYQLQTRKLLENAVLVMPTAGGTWTREQVRTDPIRLNSMMGLYTNHCNLLGLCAIAVPTVDTAAGFPFGITAFALPEKQGAAVSLAQMIENQQCQEDICIAVCGLHMRGFSLENQMLEHEAVFVRTALTDRNYRFFRLPGTPEKPGLVCCPGEGSTIEVEIWRMPANQFGAFAARIPSPLSIGTICLESGEQVKGFICEAWAASQAEDITDAGGWKNACSQAGSYWTTN